MPLRKLQADFYNVIQDIISDSPIDTIFVHACPGSGKSALPILAGRLITAGLADALCWVAPRKSLQYQAESNFIDPFFRDLIGHNLTIRSSTNEINPCRGFNGFVTTYQAIGIDSEHTVLNEFNRKRYILILDECHHVEEDSLWHKSLRSIFTKAKYKILMSGSPFRRSGKPIAFVPYNRNGSPDFRMQKNARIINYTRTDALSEKAIIPLSFSMYDGEAKWIDEIGDEVYCRSIAQITKKDTGKAVYTAISTDYAGQLLDAGLSHWRMLKKHNPGSKMLVVTAGIKHARKAVKWLLAHGENAEIATSHDTPEAIKAIKRLKQGKINILVGIGMFYEGFSCKPVTHIISLTHIRSDSWILQMVSRAVRVQPELPYEMQYGYVFCPDDPLLRSIVAKIQAEQLPFLKKRAPKKQGSLFESDDPPLPKIPYGITPIGSQMSNGREYTLGVIPPPSVKTPSEIESELREQIEKHVRKFSFVNRYRQSKINTEILRYFRKPRGIMSTTELETVLKHVEQTYPLNGNRSKSIGISGISKPRGIGRRASAEVVPFLEEN